MYKSYDLKLGYSCNNHCLHCVIEDSKQNLLKQHFPIDISTNDALRLLEDEISKGLDSVTITGGEATIRGDFSEILDFCANHSLNITLQTNGRFLSKPEIQEAISNKKITLVVALHGTNPDIHDSITRVPGSFEQTISGIQAARTNNIPVILKTVISKINMYTLSSFVPLMIKENLQDINMAFPHAQGNARIFFESIIPRYCDLRPQIMNLASLAKKNHINLSFETIPFCVLPEYPEMMSELVYRCKAVKCTQVNEDTFDWNVVRKRIKTKMPFCSSCFFDKYCEGPWSEYVDKYGISEFNPIVVQD